MSDRLFFTLAAVACLAIFASGLRSGEMPGTALSFSRTRRSIMFKAAGGFWLMMAALCAFVAIAAP